MTVPPANERELVQAVPTRAGLGNELFAYSRALIHSHVHHLRMLHTPWFRLRVGPFVRRELDKRRYHLLFNGYGEESSVASTLLRLRSRVVDEDDQVEGSGRVVRLFKGMQDAFAPLDGHSEFLRMTLKNRSAVLFVRDALPKHFVAVHVRRGDFHEPTGRPTPGVSNQRIEIGWYVRAVRAVLKELGATRVMVFSDGTNEELAPLLALDEVKRAERNNALIDILRISHATALVASGSTFSAWGAFLGSVPTIHHPGQHLYLTRPLGTAADIDWDAELPLSDVFLEYLKRRMEEEV